MCGFRSLLCGFRSLLCGFRSLLCGFRSLLCGFRSGMSVVTQLSFPVGHATTTQKRPNEYTKETE